MVAGYGICDWRVRPFRYTHAPEQRCNRARQAAATARNRRAQFRFQFGRKQGKLKQASGHRRLVKRRTSQLVLDVTLPDVGAAADRDHQIAGAGRLRLPTEAHTGFVRQAVTLAMVTVVTGAGRVRPLILAAA